MSNEKTIAISTGNEVSAKAKGDKVPLAEGYISIPQAYKELAGTITAKVATSKLGSLDGKLPKTILSAKVLEASQADKAVEGKILTIAESMAKLADKTTFSLPELAKACGILPNIAEVDGEERQQCRLAQPMGTTEFQVLCGILYASGRIVSKRGRKGGNKKSAIELRKTIKVTL